MRTGRRPLAAAAALLAGVVAATGAALARGDDASGRHAAQSGNAVVAAAGDVACDPADAGFRGGAGTSTRCRHRYTADVLRDRGHFPRLDAVLVLGDVQYEDAAYRKFLQSYAPTWGIPRLKAITRPVPGNHEYQTRAAAGYFAYFGSAAGDPTKGYYSFDIGGWHFVALNSNCSAVGGCSADSPQGRWLRDDLGSNSRRCTLAYWHHPRFSSSPYGNDTALEPFWRALYDRGADVVLVGHAHNYERFAPQAPGGANDARRGLRQFVVGTGGKSSHGFGRVQPNSEVRRSGIYGVLKLTLRPGSYDWRFVPAAGTTFTDSGSDRCRSATTSVTPAEARGLRIASVKFVSRAVARTRRLRVVISVADRSGVAVRGATVRVRPSRAHRRRVVRGARMKRSDAKGQAIVVLKLRAGALGKRLVVSAVAATPTAKARRTASVRLPSRR